MADWSAARNRVVKLSWGLVDQAASSATNLLLTVATGRVLGARSLGVVVIGFTAYLLLLGLQRALISEPVVVSTAAARADERLSASRSALTLTLLAGGALSVLMAIVGLSVGGAAGRALWLFSPWMPFALLQDLWRSILFRDSRGRAAAANDSLWLLGMALALIFAWSLRSDWAIIGAWGFGAALGATTGFAQTRLRPSPPLGAWAYWRRELWPFGRWLFGGSIAAGAGSQGSVLLTAALLGPGALGGLRAAQTVFAPLTLLSPAIALPALPAMSRRVAVSYQSAKWFAVKLSGLLAALTTAYVGLVTLGGSGLLTRIFGVSFQGYQDLILPISVQQIIAGTGGGFMLLLLATRGGHAIFAVNMVAVPLSLIAIAVGSAVGGLVGVAWGLTAVAVASAITVATLATARLPSKPRDLGCAPESRRG